MKLSPVISRVLVPPAPGGIPLPEPDEVDTVLYHKGCVDGYMARHIVEERLNGRRADFIPIAYQSPVPDVRGRNVAILDFHVPRPEYDQLLASARTLVLVDHHKTGLEWLGGLPNTIIDMEHAGAFLTWHLFHPDEPVPEMVRYVEDQDMWTWKLPRSRDYFAAIELRDMKFKAYEELSRMPFDEVVRQGAIVRQYIEKLSRLQARPAVVRNFHGHRALVVNGTAVPNEVADVLCERTDAELAFIWHLEADPDDPAKNRIKVSLRCRKNDGVDVSELAKKYPGGGGHASAAGFRVAGSDIEALFRQG